MNANSEWRVRFDAEVTFGNGGGLQVQDFRLDLPAALIAGAGSEANGAGPELADEFVAELLIRHLGLLMVEDVRISAKELLREPHRGSRGIGAGKPSERRLVELSHVIRDGMITYPGLPGPEISDHLSRAASREVYAAGTEFQIGRISMVANTSTYLDTPAHRYDGGTDLAGMDVARLADLDGLLVRVTGAGRREIDRALLGAVRRGRPRGADPHRLGPALGHRGLWQRPPVRHRRRGRLAGGAGRGPGRHRFGEHRRDQRR